MKSLLLYNTSSSNISENIHELAICKNSSIELLHQENLMYSFLSEDSHIGNLSVELLYDNPDYTYIKRSTIDHVSKLVARPSKVYRPLEISDSTIKSIGQDAVSLATDLKMNNVVIDHVEPHGIKMEGGIDFQNVTFGTIEKEGLVIQEKNAEQIKMKNIVIKNCTMPCIIHYKTWIKTGSSIHYNNININGKDVTENFTDYIHIRQHTRRSKSMYNNLVSSNSCKAENNTMHCNFRGKKLLHKTNPDTFNQFMQEFTKKYEAIIPTQNYNYTNLNITGALFPINVFYQCSNENINLNSHISITNVYPYDMNQKCENPIRITSDGFIHLMKDGVFHGNFSIDGPVVITTVVSTGSLSLRGGVKMKYIDYTNNKDSNDEWIKIIVTDISKAKIYGQLHISDSEILTVSSFILSTFEVFSLVQPG